VRIAASQNQKEVTANDAFDRLDLAVTGRLEVDFSAGDISLTDDAFRRHVAFAAVNMAEGRDLIVPAIRRLFLIDNAAEGHALTVRQGTATVAVPAGTVQLLHITGGADGLVPAAPASQAGSGASPFDIALWLPGQPEAAETLLRLEVARAFTLPENLAGSHGHAGAAATAQADLDLRKNGAALGTVTFAAGGQTASFSLAGGAAFAPGDRLELIAPATQDATLAGLALTFLGNRS